MKISLFFGIALGLLLLLWEYLFYNFLWGTTSWFPVFIPILIIGAVIFMGIRTLKYKKYQGIISYKNASLSGFLIMIYGLIIFSISVYNSYPYGNDTFAEDYIAKSRIELQKDETLSSEEIEGRLAEFKQTLNAENMAKSSGISVLIFGTLASLISSSILRKKGEFSPQ
jgi:hypothetical protein